MCSSSPGLAGIGIIFGEKITNFSVITQNVPKSCQADRPQKTTITAFTNRPKRCFTQPLMGFSLQNEICVPPKSLSNHLGNRANGLCALFPPKKKTAMTSPKYLIGLLNIPTEETDILMDNLNRGRCLLYLIHPFRSSLAFPFLVLNAEWSHLFVIRFVCSKSLHNIDLVCIQATLLPRWVVITCVHSTVCGALK